ncbi:MAG: Crp/Fnr family transcriptional regulator [Xanthomonadaceae bacterium]|nr:Crp/Fnr family transcriptional regulator [Xanthomonadaceae bacterium]
MVNERLSALPRNERDAMIEQCETVELSIGDILAEPGRPVSHVYFPAGAIVSLLATVDDDTTLEVGIVGTDGMLGVSLALGVDAATLRAVVRASGTALRMDAQNFRRCLANSEVMRTDLNHYTCVLLTQLAQTAVCTRFHLVEARLARWLLMIHDRSPDDHLELTHGLLAEMLGVRRSGITTAAGILRQNKVIKYTRGDITIIDRAALEQASCECYRVVAETAAQLLPPTDSGA